jgi:uncharacterized membrane-anchored protein
VFSFVAGLALTVGFVAANIIALVVIGPDCNSDTRLDGCGYTLLGLIAIAPVTYFILAAVWSFIVGRIRRRSHPTTRPSWKLLATTVLFACVWMAVCLVAGQIWDGEQVVLPWLGVQSLLPLASTWWWARPRADEG